MGARHARSFLARAAARAGEIAVRVSLGASRARLSRLWLLEALALAIPGAWPALRWLMRWSPPSAPLYRPVVPF